jgi:hypothetical protein
MRALKANPLLPRLPPLAAAETHSDPPHRRLSGIEPQQPDAPTTTASATDPTLPPRCRSRPATLPPPQDAYQLQLCRATGAISPPFPITPAFAHQAARQARAARTPADPSLPRPARAAGAVRPIPIRAGGRCACMLEMPAPRNGRMMWNRIQCKFAILNIN